MRAGIYTRISLDRFGDSRGVTRQYEDADKLIKLRGWDIAGQYEDNDMSAAGKRRRPAFEEMLSDITAGKLDAIVAWSFDRLSRNRVDEVRLIEACQKQSVTIALVRGSDLDMSTPSGRLVADFMASTARHEIEVKSDRQKRANLQRAKDGRPHSGRRPFGYEKDLLTPKPDEAAQIVWAYEQILAGATLRSIARHWNESGVTTTAGGKWLGNTIRQTLRNPRNAGLSYLHGERMGVGQWKPLVSEDIWKAACHILEDPARSTVTDRSIKYLLSSIAECGRCNDGSKVATGRTMHGKRNYQCNSKVDLTRAAEPIDTLTVEVVLERLSRKDAAKLLTSQNQPEDVSALRTEANAQRARMDEAAQLYASGAIHGAQLATITEACKNRAAELDERIALATVSSPLTALIGVDDIRAEWEKLDILVKRKVVKTLFKRIVIEPVPRGQRIFRPESVTFVWN
ncbi:recombinase family protein [Glutamicibacter arilaitensis]|uniref:recombinase family protein n=1 Tax=Glutamicibacter arilaitensis TaxID=256701 RepID=UPI003FD55AB7